MITVTVPATDLALLSIEELRAAAGIDEDDCSFDYRLERIGMQIAGLIASECNIASDGVHAPTLLRETIAETQRPNRCASSIMLSRRFVSDVAVTFDGVALTSGEFEVNSASGMLTRLRDDQIAIWAPGKIVATYKAGFVTAPDGLKRAAMQAVGEHWSSAQRDPLLKSESTAGLGQDEYWVGGLDAKNGSPFSSQVVAMLSPYRSTWVV